MNMSTGNDSNIYSQEISRCPYSQGQYLLPVDLTRDVNNICCNSSSPSPLETRKTGNYQPFIVYFHNNYSNQIIYY